MTQVPTRLTNESGSSLASRGDGTEMVSSRPYSMTPYFSGAARSRRVREGADLERL